MVAKGPEETTGGKTKGVLFLDGMNYVRVFPCCKALSSKPRFGGALKKLFSASC
jgi:hypothetical protein